MRNKKIEMSREHTKNWNLWSVGLDLAEYVGYMPDGTERTGVSLNLRVGRSRYEWKLYRKRNMWED